MVRPASRHGRDGKLHRSGAEIYSARLAWLLALAIFRAWPKLRKTGLYLVPFAFAMLSKPPAAVFPLLLFLYAAMFEREGKRAIAGRRFYPCRP